MQALQEQSSAPEYSVTEISLNLKQCVEHNFSHVRIRGEISGFKVHTSGHAYFALKDDQAVLDAVSWRGQVSRLSFRPEDGMEVIASGKITTYPGRSKYQIVVESMEIAGEGALLKMLEERKTRLAAEGLFDSAKKKPMPFIPQIIGVVTSPTGAVIRDILHRIEDRFPTHVILWPVAVQGQTAASEIARAIDGFQTLNPRPDVLIVGRGGGSLEDLWCFNEEEVIRAIARSEIPIISAVGHETDVTLADFAADKRAPTPTAAAEFAVPNRSDLMATIRQLNLRLDRNMDRLFEQLGSRIESLGKSLPNADEMLGYGEQRLDEWSERLMRALGFRIESLSQRVEVMRHRILHPTRIIEMSQNNLNNLSSRLEFMQKQTFDKSKDRLGNLSQLLESFSFERTIERGFAAIFSEDGQVISSVKDLDKTSKFKIKMKDGERQAATLPKT